MSVHSHLSIKPSHCSQINLKNNYNEIIEIIKLKSNFIQSYVAYNLIKIRPTQQLHVCGSHVHVGRSNFNYIVLPKL